MDNQIQPGHENVQIGHQQYPVRHVNSTIGGGGDQNGQGQNAQGQGGQQMQNQQGQGQGQAQGQGSPIPREDVMMGVDVNVPYDQNPSGDPQHTLWDDMVNALKPDLTPNKNKGNGVLGTMDVNQKGGQQGS